MIIDGMMNLICCEDGLFNIAYMIAKHMKSRLQEKDDNIKQLSAMVNPTDVNNLEMLELSVSCINGNKHAMEINKNVIPQMSGLACLAISFQINEPARKPDANMACCDLPSVTAIKYIAISDIIANMHERNRVEGSVSPIAFTHATMPHMGKGGLTNGVSPKERYGA